MKRNFLYSIEGFEPGRKYQPGGFGFIVYLDKELARKSFEKSFPENSPITEIGREIIMGYGFKTHNYFEPFSFVRNENNLTSLVHSFDVPGDACGLDLCHTMFDIKKSLYNNEDSWIQYSPHNVDDSAQASALLSLFLKWANTMACVLEMNLNFEE